jgi:hypothetical protein
MMSGHYLPVLDFVVRVLIIGVCACLAGLWLRRWLGLDSVQAASVGTSSTSELLDLFDLAVAVRHGDSTDLDSAEMYAYGVDGWQHLVSGGDVYELISAVEARVDSVSVPLVDGLSAWGLVTTGWASPLGENGEPEGRPSRHPARVRVRVLAVITESDTGNLVSFADGRDSITAFGSECGTGTLADALDGLRSTLR